MELEIAVMDKATWSAQDVFAASRLHKPMWDALWQARSCSRIALAVSPSAERVALLQNRVEFVLEVLTDREPVAGVVLVIGFWRDFTQSRKFSTWG